MSEKITMPVLVSLLAAKSGESKKQCEDFLREFFNVVVDTLSEGENIRIKGFGTFKVIVVESRKSVDVNTGEQIEIPSHRKITFVPSKEMAEEVNSPFSIFESVELPEDYSEEEKESETVSDKSDSSESISSIPESEPTYETKECEICDIAEKGEMPEPEDPVTEEEIEIVADEQKQNKKSYRFLFGFAAGLACAAVICLAFYLLFIDNLGVGLPWGKSKSENVELTSSISEDCEVSKPTTLQKRETQTESEEDKVAESKGGENAIDVPTQASDAPLYDTISKTRYLTTMAKDHYGNYNLWPYIYEENKKILGHPDRIRPGTKVAIPSLSKYGVDPRNPDDIAKAKRMGVEIYSRYK